MAMGAGVATAVSMKAPSTGTVSGDWDIDTETPDKAAHQVESVGADFFHVDWESRAAGQGQSRLTGYVYDDDGQPATNVELQISMLDAAGHEIANVFRPVRGVVPGEGRAYFDVTVPNALFHGHSYYVDFYADLNRNLRYDPPSTDHAWRIAMPAVAEGPQSISFMHDTNWTDIAFPDSGP